MGASLSPINPRFEKICLFWFSAVLCVILFDAGEVFLAWWRFSVTFLDG
jgi:hypothetical protein